MSHDYDKNGHHLPDTLDVWESRPVLRHIRDTAHARRVGPLSLLGTVLLRAVAATEPDVVLPPVVGGYASLNLILAAVGRSGAGKGSTDAAARETTTLPLTEELPLGSGEGVARTFAPPPTGKDGEPIRERTTRAIFTAAEVDTVAAVSSRQGSTLLPTIRSMWSGEALGAANAQAHTRVSVPAHSYRACLTIGVQPEAAGPLLTDTRGTAQRIVWLPVGDPDAPDVAPRCPEPFSVRRHLPPVDGRLVLELPAVAEEAMHEHRLAVLRGEDVDPLDGHRMLTRAKLAAGFMILDGRLGEITAQDWELAGWLLRASDRTRADIERELAEARLRANTAKAHAAAERDDAVGERRVQRAASGIVARLTRTPAPITRSELRRSLRSDLRPEADAAFTLLLDAGTITETKTGVVHVDTLSTCDNPRSDIVDTPVHMDTYPRWANLPEVDQ